ncbi:phosphopantetheine-binding protein [Paenibacillus rhizoplanae]
MERRLGQIWGEVLGLEEIGVHTDFFENGDSLMLMSVISRIKDDLSIDIPIQIFLPGAYGIRIEPMASAF